jgi:hypothetical protein
MGESSWLREVVEMKQASLTQHRLATPLPIRRIMAAEIEEVIERASPSRCFFALPIFTHPANYTTRLRANALQRITIYFWGLTRQQNKGIPGGPGHSVSDFLIGQFP